MALARLALAWFALTLGVAVAAPMLQPQAVQLVCDAVGGVKLVALQGDGSAGGQVLHGLDCVLCLSGGAAPVATPLPPTLPPASDCGQARKQESAACVQQARAPLPARGPPAYS